MCPGLTRGVTRAAFMTVAPYDGDGQPVLPTMKPSTKLTIEIDPSALTFTAALPESISQLTCLAVVGISPRVFLETIRSPVCRVPVIKLGNLRIVDRAEFMRWLRSRGDMEAVAPANDDGAGDVNAVLAELELERADAVPRAGKPTPRRLAGA